MGIRNRIKRVMSERSVPDHEPILDTADNYAAPRHELRGTPESRRKLFDKLLESIETDEPAPVEWMGEDVLVTKDEHLTGMAAVLSYEASERMRSSALN